MESFVELAEMLEGLRFGQLIQLASVLEIYPPYRMSDIVSACDNLDGYEFFEGIKSDRELGELILCMKLEKANQTSLYETYLDQAEGMGKQFRIHNGGGYAKFGYTVKGQSGKEPQEGRE